MKIANLKKLFFAFALILVVGVAVTGCMNRGVNENAAVVPSPSPDYMPGGATTQNTMPGGGATEGTAVQNNAMAFDWTKNAANIEAKIAQISEISEARVVVTGNTALVGVRFNAAYQGEMTERIREMVAAEVMKADPSITTVAVTSDEDDVEDVYELSDDLLAGKDMDRLKEEINEIVRNATTLR